MFKLKFHVDRKFKSVFLNDKRFMRVCLCCILTRENFGGRNCVPLSQEKRSCLGTIVFCKEEKCMVRLPIMMNSEYHSEMV